MIRAPHRSAAKVSCLTRTQSSGVQGAGCRVQQAIRLRESITRNESKTWNSVSSSSSIWTTIRDLRWWWASKRSTSPSCEMRCALGLDSLIVQINRDRAQNTEQSIEFSPLFNKRQTASKREIVKILIENWENEYVWQDEEAERGQPKAVPSDARAERHREQRVERQASHKQRHCQFRMNCFEFF